MTASSDANQRSPMIQKQAAQRQRYRLPASTTVGEVHLRVADLERSLTFYRDLLGLRIEAREDPTVQLAGGPDLPPLLLLTQQRDAPRRSVRQPGLFHVALLLPSRKDLAYTFRRLCEAGWPLHGAADHGVSEAIYLADPDGNGIELCVDRPPDRWPRKDDLPRKTQAGELQMVTEPLDLNGLLSALAPEESLPRSPDHRLRVGHVHLQVSSLELAERFYHGVLGFDVTQRSYPGALFVSAGGYHHHIGLNTWNSRGSQPAPDGASGLVSFAVELPHEEDLTLLRNRLEAAGIETRSIRSARGSPAVRARDYDNLEIHLTLQSSHS